VEAIRDSLPTKIAMSVGITGPDIQAARLASARTVLFDITTGITKEEGDVIAKRIAWECER